ncbi:MAG: HDIG domain-containing protein, partial [Defluviitaleaceae bacterium]|nr:HDIG domain-containing protein [Defluviitaleaceae bacterium]
QNMQAAEKAAADIKPLLKKDQSVVDSQMTALNGYFTKADKLRADYQTEIQAQQDAQAEADKLAREGAQAEAERLAQEAAQNYEQSASQSQDPGTDQSQSPDAEQPPAEGQNPAAEQSFVQSQSADNAPSQTPDQSQTQSPAAAQDLSQNSGQPASSSLPPTQTPAELAANSQPTALPPPSEAPSAPPVSAAPVPTADGPSALEQLSQLQVPLTNAQSVFLLSADSDSFGRIRSNTINILMSLWDQGVQDVDAKVMMSAQDMLNKTELNSDERNLAYEIIYKFVEPNYVEDTDATDAARAERASQYDTVMLLKGQTIVDEGNIITQDAFDILDSLGLVSGGLSGKILPVSGAVGVVGVFLAFLLIYIRNFARNLLKNKKEALLLFTLYILTIALVFALAHAGVAYQALPVFLFAMLASMLLDAQLGAALSVGVTVVSMLIYNGGADFLMFYAVGGVALSMLSRLATLRSKVFSVGVLASVICFALMFSTLVFFQKTYTAAILIDSGYAALNGLFTVILCIGTLPFWEALFGVATNIRYLDLANPANPLLRRLVIEAPGTYHHSLIVANLAETAAFDIGADPGLARAGGYYHDVGKLKYPQYFSENIVGENPHDFMSPKESVEIIMAHVAYGAELASRYRLPDGIRKIIGEHHGSSLLRYFYVKEANANPGAEVPEAGFRYPHEKPQFREAGIVMLADIVEATVRSMINSADGMSSIEALINKLIKEKIDDGQLTDSGLTLKDIEMSGQAFLRVFKGMYHERKRINYPDMPRGAEKDEIPAMMSLVAESAAAAEAGGKGESGVSGKC